MEDIIKQRILDESWDSVIPKRMPKAQAESEAPELSQEKSSLGLAQVYEKEFLHTAMGVAKDDEYKAARELATALFAKVNTSHEALK